MRKLLAPMALVLLLSACNSSKSTEALEKQIQSLQRELENTYKPGFGDLMGSIQIRHDKLWFAGINQNWDLADFAVHELEEVFEDKYFHDKRLMVSIFMSLFNVHANWFPVEGKVLFVHHQNGNYHKAWLPKASEENEHADIMLETPDGTTILCRQIAGAVARRIVTYAKPEEDCYIDEHLGFIKFGSRVDVYLPLGTEVCVKMGQATTGNRTVIAKLK